MCRHLSRPFCHISLNVNAANAGDRADEEVGQMPDYNTAFSFVCLRRESCFLVSQESFPHICEHFLTWGCETQALRLLHADQFVKLSRSEGVLYA